jgi:AAA family ATP:ADP antiporter
MSSTQKLFFGKNFTYKALLKLIGFESNFDFKKFLFIAIAKLFTVYIFGVLRGLEYSMLVPKLGAEVISSIELYCLLPASSLFVVLYFKLRNYFSRITIASILLVFFAIYFIIFSLFCFPNHDNLVIDLSAWKEAYPRFKYTILLIENWDITSFYVLAELWGIMMLNISFWQMANEVNTLNDAKKFYGFLGAIGQSGLILSGYFANNIGKLFTGTSEEIWAAKYNYLMLSAFICAILLLYIYWWVSKKVWNYVRIEEKAKDKAKPKVKLTVKESFKYILASNYLQMIASLIISYGVLMFICETMWKDQAAKIYINSSDYSMFMGEFQMYMGCGTVFGMIFAVFSLRYLPWVANALATPVSFTITGSIFFILVIFKNNLEGIFTTYNYSIVAAAVFFGTLQILLAKSFKYSLFDLSKEMLYIPLERELRTNGKAAVDIISQRLGRSGGSLIMLVMLMIKPDATIASLAPILFVVFIIMSSVWIFSTIKLGKEFRRISSK